MFRYILAAVALKMFSANNATKALYRRTANILGQERRKKENIDIRVIRGNWIVDLCNKYNMIKEGDKLIEIGTGWMHWYSIYLRLYYDVSITMYDICDNRQFDAMKTLFSKLRSYIKAGDAHYDQVVGLLDEISHVSSFEELYSLLNLQYVVDKDGCLRQFPDNSFDCAFSFYTLIHVKQEIVNELVRNSYRILKPGGYFIHQIATEDHLSYYDSRVSPKNYLRYSDRTWKLFFENDVQYFTRLQISDWLSLFHKEGFSLVEKTTETCDIRSLKINQKFQHLEGEDLACTTLKIVCRKPK